MPTERVYPLRLVLLWRRQVWMPNVLHLVAMARLSIHSLSMPRTSIRLTFTAETLNHCLPRGSEIRDLLAAQEIYCGGLSCCATSGAQSRIMRYDFIGSIAAWPRGPGFSWIVLTHLVSLSARTEKERCRSVVSIRHWRVVLRVSACRYVGPIGRGFINRILTRPRRQALGIGTRT